MVVRFYERAVAICLLLAAVAGSHLDASEPRWTACRVSWAKQAPSWRGGMGTPEEALTMPCHGSNGGWSAVLLSGPV